MQKLPAGQVVLFFVSRRCKKRQQNQEAEGTQKGDEDTDHFRGSKELHDLRSIAKEEFENAIIQKITGFEESQPADEDDYHKEIEEAPEEDLDAANAAGASRTEPFLRFDYNPQKKE